LNRIDANNDGEVTQREAEAQSLERRQERLAEQGGLDILSPDISTVLLANREEEA